MGTILVVDDERSIRTLCEEELCREGYDVVSTGRCREVQELIASSQPAVLVLDIRLDECDSFSLLEDIRKKYRTLPIILYTAYDSYRDDVRCTAADYYVIKSFDLTELKETIAVAVGQNQKSRKPPIFMEKRFFPR